MYERDNEPWEWPRGELNGEDVGAGLSFAAEGRVFVAEVVHAEILWDIEPPIAQGGDKPREKLSAESIPHLDFLDVSR